MSGLPLFSLSALRPAYDFSAMFKSLTDSVTAAGATPAHTVVNSHIDGQLSEQQYRDLLAHLNRYVESYVNDRIVDVAPAKPAVFSSQHVADISAMIDERVAEAANNAGQINQPADVDRIVSQILQSNQLTDHIVRSVDKRSEIASEDSDRLISEQKQLIHALQQEIAQINGKLVQHVDAQQNVDLSIRLLQAHQDNLSAQFREFQSANEQRLAALLLEVNVRLDDLGRSQFVAIDDRVKLVLMDVLGFRTADGAEPDMRELQNWIRSVFVAKSVLEERLLALQADQDRFVQSEIERSSGVLMKEITERIRAETIGMLERQRVEVLQASEDIATSGSGAMAEEAVRRIVREALAIYDADKTGLVDYALESAGGEIVSTRCTETYHTKSAQISIFGIPLWYPTNTPRTAISPTVQPGQCWAFQGFPGFLGELCAARIVGSCVSIPCPVSVYFRSFEAERIHSRDRLYD